MAVRLLFLLVILLVAGCDEGLTSYEAPRYTVTFQRIMLEKVGCDSLLSPPDNLDAEVRYYFAVSGWDGLFPGYSVYWPDSLYAVALKAGEWHALVRPDGTPAAVKTVEAGEVPCGPGARVLALWGEVYDWDEGNGVEIIGRFDGGFCSSEIPLGTSAIHLAESAGTSVVLEYTIQRAAR